MPKPRKAGQAQSLFAVSPWHDKAEDKAAQLPVTAGDQAYHVVELPLVINQTAHAASSGAGAQPAQQQGTVEAAGPGVPWVARKRKAGVADGDPAGLLGGCSVPDAASTDSLQQEGQEQEQQGEAAAAEVLEGTAVLAVLPNDSITGHLLPHEGRRRSIGLMGREVLAYRDCTRDAEWRVLRMTAIDFGGGGGGEGGGGGQGRAGTPREASFLVERTEGDAMKLRAPIAWQGAEVDTMEQLSQGCQPGMELEFDCEQLLVEAAADAELRKVQPSLCGRGALVNTGRLRLTWPLGDGAGAWDGSGGGGVVGAEPAGAGARLLPSPGGGARGVVGAGPGSGRTIVDNDDW